MPSFHFTSVTLNINSRKNIGGRDLITTLYKSRCEESVVIVDKVDVEFTTELSPF